MKYFNTMKKIVFLIILFLFISMIKIEAQTLYIKTQRDPIKGQGATQWSINVNNGKIVKHYVFFKSSLYDKGYDFGFTCEDKALHSQTLPIAQLSNYPAKTMQEFELEVANLTYLQRNILMRGFQNIYIIQTFPDNPSIFELSKVKLNEPIRK